MNRHAELVPLFGIPYSGISASIFGTLKQVQGDVANTSQLGDRVKTQIFILRHENIYDYFSKNEAKYLLQLLEM
jgi:hypothetical protein